MIKNRLRLSKKLGICFSHALSSIYPLQQEIISNATTPAKPVSEIKRKHNQLPQAEGERAQPRPANLHKAKYQKQTKPFPR